MTKLTHEQEQLAKLLTVFDKLKTELSKEKMISFGEGMAAAQDSMRRATQ